MNPADQERRLTEDFAEQAENLRMLLRAAIELRANAQRLGSFSATPTDAERDVQDRFVFRFSKTVDAMRKRLFPHILDYTDNLSDFPSLRDRLNRLEKYGLLDANRWIELGLRRNAFEHDYPDEASRAAALQQAVESIADLVLAYTRCRDWLVTRYGLRIVPVSLELSGLADGLPYSKPD